MQDIFAHAINRIDFLDGMIRIELAIARVAEGQGETASGQALDPVYALHMPLGGFMRSAVMQEQFIREMVRRGILPTPDQAAAGAAASAPAAEPAVRSPNFG